MLANRLIMTWIIWYFFSGLNSSLSTGTGLSCSSWPTWQQPSWCSQNREHPSEPERQFGCCFRKNNNNNQPQSAPSHFCPYGISLKGIGSNSLELFYLHENEVPSAPHLPAVPKPPSSSPFCL